MVKPMRIRNAVVQYLGNTVAASDGQLQWRQGIYRLIRFPGRSKVHPHAYALSRPANRSFGKYGTFIGKDASAPTTCNVLRQEFVRSSVCDLNSNGTDSKASSMDDFSPLKPLGAAKFVVQNLRMAALVASCKPSAASFGTSSMPSTPLTTSKVGRAHRNRMSNLPCLSSRKRIMVTVLRNAARICCNMLSNSGKRTVLALRLNARSGSVMYSVCT